jgi:Uma2 family endonuclease
MSLKTERKQAGLSVDAFRAFYHGRLDEERWELIDGVPTMAAPPTFVHQRIASNLERALNDALEAHEPAWAAYQRGGLNLKRTVANYDPEPDVVVVDVVLAAEQHYADRSILRPRSCPTAIERPCPASAKSTNCIRIVCAS